jgi:hypothetical protein
MRLYQIHDTDGEESGLILVTEDRLRRPQAELDEKIDEVAKDCKGDCNEMEIELSKHDIIAERMFVEDIYA